MNQGNAASSEGVALPRSKRCPFCGEMVSPDALGLYECVCGWGGPDDPLEHDRGLAKALAKMDRSLADSQAHRDLRRLATRGDSASSLNVLYLALLLLIATVTYVVVLAIIVLCLWLIVSTILDHTWLGAIVGGIILALIIGSLWPQRRSRKSVLVTRERFPALMAALDEVSQRVGVRIPKRVVLTPGDEFDIMRMMRGGEILRIGAANLPLLSDVELKSLLTHELAHAHKGYTAFHRYSVQAEDLLREFVYGILEGVAGQSYGAMRRTQRWVRGGGDLSSSVSFVGLVFTWTVMLPFRILWAGYHLLRLHESRMAEFAADRAAIHAYGPQAFINGLTGLLVSQRTLAKSWASLHREMLRHNSQNFYAEMRRHYSELPPNVVSQLRVEATTGFRTLSNSHPTTPDRLRAAYATLGALSPSPAPATPAHMLLATDGASNADAVEVELTKLLLTPRKR